MVVLGIDRPHAIDSLDAFEGTWGHLRCLGGYRGLSPMALAGVR